MIVLIVKYYGEQTSKTVYPSIIGRWLRHRVLVAAIVTLNSKVAVNASIVVS